MDAARLETGELPVRPRPTDLAALARAVVAARRATAPGHALAVRAPGPVVAPVDAARFEALLGNLLDNAVKYSPAGGPVEVDVEADGAGQARVAVRDRGVGVPPERRAGLFDRFHPTPGTHLDGLGLGLYLSRRIAERHGGSIAVEHPEDGGTRVVVTLPLATPAPDGRQRAAAGPDPVPRP